MSPPISAHPSFFRKHAVKLGASMLVAIGLWLILHHGGLPVVPPRTALANVRWWTVAVYALSITAWSFVRAMRTRHLLRPIAKVPARQILTVSWIGFMAIFFLPFRLGEFVRPALFHHKKTISFTTATGAFGAERIIDGLILMLLLGIALPMGHPLSPLPHHIGTLPIPVAAVPAAAYTALTIFFSAFLLMSFFYWKRDLARTATLRVLGIFSKRLAELIADQVEKLSSGFRFLPTARHLIPYLLETILYWGIAAAGMWLLGWGCGLDGMTFVRSITMLGVLGLGIVVPGAPGYFGAFQGAIYAGLALYFSETQVLSAGSTYVFLLYISQLGMMFLHAAIAGVMDQDAVSATRRGLEPAHAHPQQGANRPENLPTS